MTGDAAGAHDASDPATAAQALAAATGVRRHDVAVVLGSGWQQAADALGPYDVEVPVEQLGGFQVPAVPGHGGTVRSLRIGEQRVLVLLGRTHLYESLDPVRVVHGVRTACEAGVRTVVLTNAAGGLREDYRVGQPVLISDHLNLTGTSPLSGAGFVDMTEAYPAWLRTFARDVDPTLPEGIYAGLRGPQFETPAEIRMLRTLGADLVGMSTVLETIAAAERGAAVLGLSLVTNLAAGVSGEPLDHEEVLAAGQAAAANLGELLAKVVARL